MAKIITLKDDLTNEVAYPQTKASAVYMDNNNTVQEEVTELGQETDIRFGDTGLFILYQGTYVPEQGKYNTASNRVITSFLPNKGTVKVKSGFKTMKYDVFDKFGVYVSTVSVSESGEYSWETNAGEYIKLTFRKSDDSDITPETDIVDYIKTGLTERFFVVEGKVDASILYSDSNQLNSLVKELYVPSAIAAYSAITIVRIFKAYVNGNEYVSGLTIYVNNSYIPFYKSFSTQAEALAYCKNIEYEKDGNSIYAVVDWDKIETGERLTISANPKNIVNNVEFSPRIKEYIDQKSCVTDSDITIERVSDNIANPNNIQVGTYIGNVGQIRTGSWDMIGIPVSEGDVITAGGFDLKRSGYYAFYNGATKVSYDSFTNPAGTTNPLTLTAPSGCDTLYIDIKTDETGSNYDSLMINYGSTLKDYDEYKEAITKINNTDLAGSGGGTSADLGTLIVDLPVSDGTGIASGYAYIDSTDRSVKVKA